MLKAMKYWIFYVAMFSAHLHSFTHPIDIVYLWVDGNDPVWQEIKNNHLSVSQNKAAMSADGFTDNRFADHEELRYSLRSILKYAPFFNHIYIVTMNQRPRWLLDHPKITIIDHTEIFKDLRNLPTFNSHALESNLHRIPYLAEYFIYFNDDVFLGAPVQPTDFFTIEGKIRALFETSLSPSGPASEQETLYRKAWRNTNALLDTRFKKEPRYRLCHAPFALRKSFMQATEQDVAFVFEGNSSHKFRSDKDFNMTNGFLQYYWSYHELIESGTMRNMMVSLRDDSSFEHTERRLAKLKKNKPHTFCLQDVMTDNSNKTKKLLHRFLESYYPETAPWEK